MSVAVLLGTLTTVAASSFEKTSGNSSDNQQLRFLQDEMARRLKSKEISFEAFAAFALQVFREEREEAREERERAERRGREERERAERLAREEREEAREERERAERRAREERERAREERKIDLLILQVDSGSTLAMAFLPVLSSITMMAGIFQCCASDKSAAIATQMRTVLCSAFFLAMMVLSGTTSSQLLPSLSFFSGSVVATTFLWVSFGWHFEGLSWGAGGGGVQHPNRRSAPFP
jgi:hypothetical protein